jgi:hypothetical protein
MTAGRLINRPASAQAGAGLFLSQDCYRLLIVRLTELPGLERLPAASYATT